MRQYLTLAMVLAAVGAFALPAVAGKGPASITFDGPRKPPVVFDHAGHQAKIADCKACHHMGVGTGTCKDCHGVTDKAPTVKRAFHKSCRGCHTRMNVANYRDCGFCHK
jgi:hypothetical protein